MTPRALLSNRAKRATALAFAGTVALALGAAATVLGGTLFAAAWLAAALVWGCLPLGALAILMAHGLTGGRWGEQGRPLWLALAATLPLFAAALLPLLFGMSSLFAWAAPAQELPELVQNKLAYLNTPFFMLRSLVYFTLWLWLAHAIGAWRPRCRRIQAPGLILWLLTLTFFSFDWLMSLEPEFYSDVYGLMLAANAVVAAFAWVLLLGGSSMDPDARRDIANLWLGVLLGWALFAFSQYIVIWSANLPDEIGWYVHRSRGLWRLLSAVSFALFFLLPFAVLLSGKAKGRADWLAAAAASCLLGHLLQMGWLVLPAFGDGSALQLLLLCTLVLVIGIAYLALYAAIRAADRRGEEHGRTA